MKKKLLKTLACGMIIGSAIGMTGCSGSDTEWSITGVKSSYEINDSLYGIRLKLELDNDTTKVVEVTPEMIIDYPDMSTPGEKTIYFEYDGKEYSFKIKVVAPIVNDYSFSGYKEYYYCGEAFSLENTKLNLDMSYGEDLELNVSPEMIVSMPDMTTIGRKIIKVNYAGKEYSYSIMVKSLSGVNEANFKIWLDNYINSGKVADTQVLASIIGKTSLLGKTQNINQNVTFELTSDMIENDFLTYLYKGVVDGIITSSLQTGQNGSQFNGLTTALNLLFTAKNVLNNIDASEIWKYLMDNTILTTEYENFLVDATDTIYYMYVGDAYYEKETNSYIELRNLVETYFNKFVKFEFFANDLLKDFKAYLERNAVDSEITNATLFTLNEILGEDSSEYEYALSDFVKFMFDQLVTVLDYENNDYHGRMYDVCLDGSAEDKLVAKKLLNDLSDNVYAISKVLEYTMLNLDTSYLNKIATYASNIKTAALEINDNGWYIGGLNNYKEIDQNFIEIVGGLFEIGNIASHIYENKVAEYITDTNIVEYLIIDFLDNIEHELGNNAEKIKELKGSEFSLDIQNYIVDLLENPEVDHRTHIEKILSYIELEADKTLADEVEKYLTQVDENGYCTLLYDIANYYMFEVPESSSEEVKACAQSVIDFIYDFANFFDLTQRDGFDSNDFIDKLTSNAENILAKFKIMYENGDTYNADLIIGSLASILTLDKDKVAEFIEDTDAIKVGIDELIKFIGRDVQWLLETNFALDTQNYILELISNFEEVDHRANIEKILSHFEYDDTSIGAEVNKYLTQLEENGYMTLFTDLLDMTGFNDLVPAAIYQDSFNSLKTSLNYIANYLDRIPVDGFDCEEFLTTIQDGLLDFVKEYNKAMELDANVDDSISTSMNLLSSLAAFMTVGDKVGCDGIICNHHEGKCVDYNKILKFIPLPEGIESIDYNKFINKLKDEGSYVSELAIDGVDVSYITDDSGLKKQVLTLTIDINFDMVVTGLDLTVDLILTLDL